MLSKTLKKKFIYLTAKKIVFVFFDMGTPGLFYGSIYRISVKYMKTYVDTYLVLHNKFSVFIHKGFVIIINKISPTHIHAKTEPNLQNLL